MPALLADQLPRQKICRKCSYKLYPHGLAGVEHEGELTGREEARMEEIKKKRTRGGKKHKQTEGERAAQGRSRKSGGGIRSPIAHQVVRAMVGAMAAAAGAELWMLVRTARHTVEDAVLHAGALVSTTLLEAEGIAEGVGEVLRGMLRRVDNLTGQLAGLIRLCLPVVVVACALLVLAYGWRTWHQTAKEMMAGSGRNPEANVESQRGAQVQERVRSLFARYQTDQKIPWLTEEAAMQDVRNKEGARSLLPAVREKSRGLFQVASERGAGAVYEVILDLADLGPRPAKSMVVECSCMDHLRRGPVCKHAGAALLLMAGGGAGAEAEKHGGMARGLVSASAPGPPAPGAALMALTDGAVEAVEAGRLTAEKIKVLKEKAERLRAANAQAQAVGRPASSSWEGAPAEVEATEVAGTVLSILDAVGSQTAAQDMLKKAGKYVLLLAFTYDREDLTRARCEGKRRGLELLVGVLYRFVIRLSKLPLSVHPVLGPSGKF